MKSYVEVDRLISQWKAEGLSRQDIVRKTAEACMGWPYAWGAVGAECTPEKRRYYMGRSSIGPGDAELIRKRCQVLNGSKVSCRSCKYFPGGEKTRINDCQGFVKQVFSAAGIRLTGGGCTSMWRNDSLWQEKGGIGDLPKDWVCCVFKYIASTGKMDHIGIHIGGGDIIHCSVEVKAGKVTDKGWTHYAIPVGMDGDAPPPEPGKHPTLRRGDSGSEVAECQRILLKRGYDLGAYGADGKFGAKTEAAVKAFQRDNGLAADGVCGPMTWAKLDAAEVETRYTVTIPHVAKAKAEELLRLYPGATREKE